MKIVSGILFLFFFALNLSNAQNQIDKVLAEIGDEVVTVGEFVERYQLTPFLRRNKSEEELKTEMLYTIIAEKLWAKRAGELGYDTSATIQFTYKTLEKMYVRDALYNMEIKSKIKITDNEISEGISRDKYNLTVEYIFSADSDLIELIYSDLNSGISFGSIADLRKEAPFQYKQSAVTFGDLEEPAEDAAYSLKAGEISPPVKSSTGWYIVKLVDKNERNISDERQRKSEDKKVKSIVEARITDRIYQNYFRKFFSDRKVNTNGYIFWSIADKLVEILLEKRGEQKDSTLAGFNLESKDFYRIENELGPDTLKMNFIEFEGDPVSTEEFLRGFIFEGFYTNMLNPDILRAQFQSRVKRFIELELFAREGYKQGLQNLPDVQKSINMWKRNYLAQMMKNQFIDSSRITDEEALKYYKDPNKELVYPVEVNIIEILTDSLETVELVLNELEKRGDIKELAAKYTKRVWTKNKGGEFGFFPVTMYSDIGRVARQMEIGEVYGPLKVPEGYSIFKLIGRKEEEKKNPGSFEETKNELKDKLRLEKLKRIMVKETVELAGKYGLRVDENLINSIKVKNFSMLVYKYMGFGGRVLAYPLTIPFVDWVLPWKDSQKILP